MSIDVVYLWGCSCIFVLYAEHQEYANTGLPCDHKTQQGKLRVIPGTRMLTLYIIVPYSDL